MKWVAMSRTGTPAFRSYRSAYELRGPLLKGGVRPQAPFGKVLLRWFMATMKRLCLLSYDHRMGVL